MYTYTVKYFTGKRADHPHELEVQARTPASAMELALQKLPFVHGTSTRITIDTITRKAPEPPHTYPTPHLPKLNTHDMQHLVRCPVECGKQLHTSDGIAVYVAKRITHRYGAIYFFSFETDKYGDPLALIGWTTSTIVHSAYLQYIPTHTSIELRKCVCIPEGSVK